MKKNGAMSERSLNEGNKEGVITTLELFKKHSAYWTASNKGLKEYGRNIPGYTVESSFGEFERNWNKHSPEMQQDLAALYEEGYEAYMERSMADGLALIERLQTDAAYREEVQQKLERLLAI